jgi:hypothetical protein
MAKNVFNEVKHIYPVALECFGWCCFVVGTIMDNPISTKLILLSAARVLPLALRRSLVPSIKMLA